MLVFPSLHEGFGLPVLEALACGTAVGCSDRASLPEVGGGVVDYFDPDDAEAVAAAMLRILKQAHDPSGRSARANHAAGFCWRKHWNGCQQEYRGLLE